MKFYNLQYFVREALSSIVTHRFMSVAAAGVICACLLITGSFFMVAVNVESLLEEVENQNEVVVFVDEAVEDAKSIESKLMQVKNVTEVEFVSKESAYEAFSAELGEESELLEGLEGDNPLRDRYIVHLSDISLTAETAESLKEVEGIAKVQARDDIADKILKVRSLVTAICLVLISVLLAVSIFIISNTVSLTIFNRREEIAIMKMVGATDGFVRVPFLIEGMIIGVLGAVVALVLQWGVYEYVAATALEGFAMLNVISFADLLLPLAAVFGGVGVLVGVVGSAITLRKFLRV